MLTGLTCSQVGLTDASTSLTYAHTGLIGASSELGCSTKAKIRIQSAWALLEASAWPWQADPDPSSTFHISR